MTDTTIATPTPIPSSPGMPTKACTRCQVEKPLVAFTGKRKVCRQCEEAAKARTLLRREAIRFSPEISARICDLIAMRTPVTRIAEMAGMPTVRQLYAWRREHEEFRAAYDLAREQRAEARSDRIDEVLDDLKAGKIDAPTARVIIESELKLASKEAPARYGDVTKIQQEVSGPNGAPLAVSVVDDASLIKTARWVADLLSKADAVPVLDLKPEAPA